MTQTEMADALGYERSAISRMEKQDSELSPVVGAKIQAKLAAMGLEKLMLEPAAAYGPVQKPIPYFDVDVMATPIDVFNDQTTRPAYTIDMPGFHDCDFAINVFGHSMYPTIESGMIALCKKVQDVSLLMYGEVYFIVTEDFRMVKRLIRSDKPGHIIAASDNHNGHASPDGKTYAPIEIPIEKILHLYVVKGVFKRCLI